MFRHNPLTSERRSLRRSRQATRRRATFRSLEAIAGTHPSGPCLEALEPRQLLAVVLDLQDSTGGINFATDFTEGTTAGVPLADTPTLSPDNVNVSSIVVTLTNRPDGDSESLGFDNTPGGFNPGTVFDVVPYNSLTGVLVLNAKNPVAGVSVDDALKAIQDLRYFNTDNDPDTTAPRTISFTLTNVTPETTQIPLPSASISITAVNDPPTFAPSYNLTSVGTIQEDAKAIPANLGIPVSNLVGSSALTPGNRVLDDDNSERGIAVTFVDNSKGTWQYFDTTPVTGGWKNFGSPSPTAARLLPATAGSAIRFIPLLDDGVNDINGTLANIITFHAWDQSTGTPFGTDDVTTADADKPFSTASRTLGITLNPVNDAPIVTTTGTTLSYTEGQGPKPIDYNADTDTGVLLRDVDSTRLSRVTVTFDVTGFQADKDTLALSQSGVPIRGDWNKGTRILTLTPRNGTSATIEQFQAALRAVTFETTDENPTAARTIRIQAFDDDNAGSIAVARTIVITPVNTPQTIAVNGSVPQMNSAVEPQPIDVFMIQDVDAGNDYELTITAPSGTILATSSPLTDTNPASHILNYVGTFAQVKEALDTLTFDPNGVAGNLELTVTLDDRDEPGNDPLDPANRFTVQASTTVSVQPVADLDVDITSPSTPPPFSVPVRRTSDFTFKVTNTGPNATPGATLTILVLGAGVSVEKVTLDGTEVAKSQGQVVIDLGALNPGAANARTVTISVKPSQSNAFEIRASTSHSSNTIVDPDVAGNSTDDNKISTGNVNVTDAGVFGFSPLFLGDGVTYDELNEGKKDYQFQINRNSGTVGAVDLTFRVISTTNPANRTAELGVDYEIVTSDDLTALGNNQYKIKLKDGQATAQVPFKIVGDRKREFNEDIVLELLNPGNTIDLDAGATKGTVTIRDDESLVVLNKQTSGFGSLSDRILTVLADPTSYISLETDAEGNQFVVPARITFDLTEFGTDRTITLAGVSDLLPEITVPIYFDAQTGGNPVVITTTAGLSRGLKFSGVADPLSTSSGQSSIVEGLEFSGFDTGIQIDTGYVTVRDSILSGNKTGIQITGPSNTIGGTSRGAGNVIKGSTVGSGIAVSGSTADNNVIQNNVIGLFDKDGSKTDGNKLSGISATSVSSLKILDNVISGNSEYGINLTSTTDAQLLRNRIGTNPNATGPFGNTKSGILLTSTTNTSLGSAEAFDANVISGNKENGLEIAGGSNIDIFSNLIGLDGNGSKQVRNNRHGILVTTTTAGVGASDLEIRGNTISGNGLNDGNSQTPDDWFGLYLANGTTNVRIEGNRIGTNVAGSDAIGNLAGGVYLDAVSNVTIGGSTDAARNIISGNGTVAAGTTPARGSGITVASKLVNNVVVFATNITITGNYIGTGSGGGTDLGNAASGIVLVGTTDVVKIEKNVVSGNDSYGLEIGGTPTNLTIHGNTIGANKDGSGPVANGVGVILKGVSNITVGGTTASARNVISGNNASGITITSGVDDKGTQDTSDDVVVQAKSISILGNYIGTNATGTADVGNRTEGVRITGGTDHSIGSAAAGAGNVISGNNDHGIRLTGGTATIAGNFIGTNATGTGPLGNGDNALVDSGVFLDGVTGVTVGGTTAAERNLISANNGAGIRIVGGQKNQIQGNYIGTGVSGDESLGNIGPGVLVGGGSQNMIGGTATASRNVIASNLGGGVLVNSSSSLNVVAANYIGTTAGGAERRGNTDFGVRIDRATDNRIGGPTAAEQNLISANFGEGVEIIGIAATTGNLVQGNRIGTTADGKTSLGNNGSGVLISGAGANTISRNTIAGNDLQGIRLVNSTGVMVEANAIGLFGIANGLSGIEIAGGSKNVVGSIDTQSANGPIALTSSAINTIQYNLGDGVLLTGGTTANVVGHNVIRENQGNGIQLLTKAADNVLVSNVIQHNLSNGILLSGDATMAVASNYVFKNLVGDPLFNTDIVDEKLANLGDGIALRSAGKGNVLVGNDVAGNRNTGLLVANTEGTLVQATGDFEYEPEPGKKQKVFYEGGNVFIGNLGHGILLSDSTGTVVTGNWIGVDSDGGLGKGNRLTGVFVVGGGGNTIGGANTIGDNDSNGIVLFRTSNTSVAGNRIGTNEIQAPGLGNRGEGILILDSSANRLERNIVANSTLNGVHILDSRFENPEGANTASPFPAERNLLLGNTLVGNVRNGVLIAGASNNTVGLGNQAIANRGNGIAVLGNSKTRPINNVIVDAFAVSNGLDGVNLTLDGPRLTDTKDLPPGEFATSITRTWVYSNGEDGVSIFSSNGAKVDQSIIHSNARAGVRIEEGSQLSEIGLTTSPLPNQIYGNRAVGVEIRDDSTRNVVLNSYVGLDASNRPGSIPQPIGILLNNVTRNTIGNGDYKSSRPNVISGNAQIGVQIVGLGQTGATGGGNFVLGNRIGTNTAGTDAVYANRESRPTVQIYGVEVLNSAGNAIRENLVSGNDSAGLLIQGVGSFENRVSGNLVGSSIDRTAIVLATDDTLRADDIYRTGNVYATGNRQDAGIFIDDAPSNVVEDGNEVYANYTGIHIQGGNADDNVIRNNKIGPAINSEVNDASRRIGNYYGLEIKNASSNQVDNNDISRNVSVGISIVDTTAINNRVTTNRIKDNGAYGEVVKKANGEVIPGVIRLVPRATGALAYGVGVYIERARNNQIGSAAPTGRGVRENTALGNRIVGNTLANVMIFNNASGNQVRSNTIKGDEAGDRTGQTRDGIRRETSWYGILLYNSIGNLDNNIPRSGKYAPTGHAFANFREYTGNVPKNATVIPPNGPGNRFRSARRGGAVPGAPIPTPPNA